MIFARGEFGEPTRFERAIISGNLGFDGMDGSGDDLEFKQQLEELADKSNEQIENKDES